MTDNPVLPDGTVTIGKPIGNVKVYIVDEQLHLVPIGVPGELCVGGVQVARGYLNRPELTAEKFIKNPFSTGEDRIYRTGDIALWLPDGNIEYLGRLDEQIKVAGHRIECGEIESVLRTNELIEDAVVALNEKEGNQRLAAFYKPKKRIELWPSIAEFFIYDDIVYRSMYEHTSRNDKYRAALEKVVKDKTVLEIGPGPEAVLSRLCLDTGAKHVYAVEILEETYLKAKRCIEALGLTDKITLIHGDIRDVVLPEKVDYCVSEIVGSIGGSEGSAVLIDLAKKFLKDPSNMIPGRSTTKIAALTLDDTSFEYGFSDIAYQYVEKIEDTLGEDFEFRLCLKNMPKQNIISSEDIFEDLDYRNNLDYNLTHDITLSNK
jgi:predicted RNA methylase